MSTPQSFVRARIWTMTTQVLAPHGNAVQERCSKGVKFRSLHPKDMLSSEIEYPELDCIKRRYLPKTSVIMVLTEKKAAICFPFFGGTPDLKAFFGEDPSFMKWTTELYLNYWNQGEVLHKRTKTK